MFLKHLEHILFFLEPSIRGKWYFKPDILIGSSIIACSKSPKSRRGDPLSTLPLYNICLFDNMDSSKKGPYETFFRENSISRLGADSEILIALSMSPNSKFAKSRREDPLLALPPFSTCLFNNMEG